MTASSQPALPCIGCLAGQPTFRLSLRRRRLLLGVVQLPVALEVGRDGERSRADGADVRYEEGRRSVREEGREGARTFLLRVSELRDEHKSVLD